MTNKPQIFHLQPPPSGFFLFFTGLLLTLWILNPQLCFSANPVVRASSPPKFEAEAIIEILVDGRLAGSGCFISPDGLTITAAHTVKQARQIEILSQAFGRLSAKLIATDIGHDISLLKVQRTGRLFPYLPLAQDIPALGDQLFISGSALYRHRLLLEGKIANPEIQYEWNKINKCYTEVFYVESMTPKGLSGAPWLNLRGEIVGVQSGMLTWQGALQGIAYASPASAINYLLSNKQAPKFTPFGATLAESWEGTFTRGKKVAEGLFVTRIINESPAKSAGIKKGDVISGINGQPINYRNQFLQRIRHKSPQTPLYLNIKREEKDFTIVLQNKHIKK